MKPRIDSAAQCVVAADDYAIYWENAPVGEAETFTPKTGRYDGPERRANAHDRRWINGLGGRRLLDRKS